MPTAHSIDLDTVDAVALDSLSRYNVRIMYHERLFALDRALDALLLPELVAYYYANTTKPAFRPS